MSAWKVILATLVIFATGIVVGGLLVNKAGVASPSASQPARPPGMNPGQFGLQSLLHRMDRELALTSDQHEQIQKIIAASQDRTGELWKPVSQELSKETTAACEQIRGVLTPEQQTKFDEMLARMKERGEHGPRKPKDE